MRSRIITGILTITGLLPLFVNAQTNPFSIGVKAGFNYSTAFESVNYLNGNIGYKPGYQAGVTVDYSISNIFLQSGLQFTVKGTKHKDADLWIGGENAPVTYWVRNSTLNYLQIPLKVGYRVPVSKSFSVFVNGGGYFAYGIGGKIVTKRDTPGPWNIPYSEIKTNSFGEEEFSFDKPDAGITFGAGITFCKFTLGIDYDLGMVNIGTLRTPETYSQRTYKNSNLALTIGYKLK